MSWRIPVVVAVTAVALAAIAQDLLGSPAPQNAATPSYGNGTTLYVDSCPTTTCSSGGSISDNNDCSQNCTAPGVGPCAHGYAVANRWGTWDPTFTSTTTVDVLSNCAGEHLPVQCYTLNDAGCPVVYPDGGAPAQVEITFPARVQALEEGASQQFAATTSTGGVTWSVQSGGGSVTSGGIYTAPSSPGVYNLTATSTANPGVSDTAQMVVAVVSQANSTSWFPGPWLNSGTAGAFPGLPGTNGVPARTTVCQTLLAATYGNGTINVSTDLQTAITNCPAGEIVVLGAGTFKWTGTVHLNKGITLRGAGMGKTVINGNTDTTEFFQVGPQGPPESQIFSTMLHHTLLTANAVKGTSTIQVTSAAGYSVGDLALITQADDASVWPPPNNGGDFLLWIDPSADAGVPVGDASVDQQRHSRGQVVKIAGISGNTITIDHVLHQTFTTANLAVLGDAPSVVRGAGIEGMTFNQPSQSFFTFCDSCWLLNTEFSTLNGDVGFWITYRNQISDTYFHNSQTYAQGGGGYGLTINSYASSTLITNNIFYYFNKPFLFRASGGGNVLSYNYVTGAQDSASGSNSWMEPDVDCHMVDCMQELEEGNLAGQIGSDNTWGGAGAYVMLRNRAMAVHVEDANLANFQCQNQAGIGINAGNGIGTTVLGNVIGWPGLVATGICGFPGTPSAYWNVNENDPAAPPVTNGGYEGTQTPAELRIGNASILGSYTAFDVNETDYPSVARVLPSMAINENFSYARNAVVVDAGAPAVVPNSMYVTGAPDFFDGGTWPWVSPTTPDAALTLLPARARCYAPDAGACTPDGSAPN